MRSSITNNDFQNEIQLHISPHQPAHSCNCRAIAQRTIVHHEMVAAFCPSSGNVDKVAPAWFPVYACIVWEDDEKMDIMRKAFQMFDTQKSGFIETLRLKTILNSMGQMFEESELQELVDENDPEDTGKVNFDGFCNIAAHFLEEEDAEAIQKELKEAFRLYDREGNGYITTSTLKEILAALDDKLSSSDLDGIIAEIDTDGSGTVDFDEFMEMMTGD
ncbi:troponin C-like isoform X7 [Rhagoletis pomonella]|uniref:troponin C-like isoform X7 n=1 Tax=Rhagoletis pomonella TaxID=28610 RepID=UPI0017842C4C|nr:troponin C-like isoform X7 [Rhagoletis pomonella]